MSDEWPGMDLELNMKEKLIWLLFDLKVISEAIFESKSVCEWESDRYHGPVR